MAFWLVDLLAGWPFEWLVFWLVGLLAGPVGGFPSYWLAVWLSGWWPSGWFAFCLVGLHAYWPSGWLALWLVGIRLVGHLATWSFGWLAILAGRSPVSSPPNTAIVVYCQNKIYFKAVSWKIMLTRGLQQQQKKGYEWFTMLHLLSGWLLLISWSADQLKTPCHRKFERQWISRYQMMTGAELYI